MVGDYSRFEFDDTVFGALVQYPATDGAIFDYEPISSKQRTMPARSSSSQPIFSRSPY